MKTIEIECPACKGTGLYQGFAEKDGAAVVCYHCGGTGKTTFTYNKFTGKKLKEGVIRIFDSSHGYVQSAGDVTTKDGTIIHFSEGGCTYVEWLSGVKPRPVKELYCPYIFNNRGMGLEPLDKCREGCGFNSISNCKYYSQKGKCWLEYESREVK